MEEHPEPKFVNRIKTYPKKNKKSKRNEENRGTDFLRTTEVLAEKIKGK